MTTETAPKTAARPAVAPRMTLADLHRFGDVKAELINGRIVELPMPGEKPTTVASEIFVSLRSHAKSVLRRGRAFPDGADYTVPILRSGRESFRPDASYHVGPFPDDPMEFIPSAPTFAVEVRSKGDYGPAAEAEMTAKRADYFEAGTLAVWDVDTQARTVKLYTPSVGPATPTATFAAGDVAHAEPAVPGWGMPVADVFAD